MQGSRRLAILAADLIAAAAAVCGSQRASAVLRRYRWAVYDAKCLSALGQTNYGTSAAQCREQPVSICAS